jgi:hypothetical protein
MLIEARIPFIFKKLSPNENFLQINGQAQRDCRPRLSLPKLSAATPIDDSC